MKEVVVTTGAIVRAKLQSKCRRQQTSTRLFTGRMPFLSPSQHANDTTSDVIPMCCRYSDLKASPQATEHSVIYMIVCAVNVMVIATEIKEL